MGVSARKPALLTTTSYYGTIAAIRCLGRNGIEVSAADSKPLASGLSSRFVGRKLQCPPTYESEAFAQWLFRFGDENPGHVLYPTSDDTAWLFSAFRDELSKRYAMFQPSLEAIYTLLNKKHLHAAAKAAGCDVPATWCPSSIVELRDLAPTLDYPVLIKPQTQVLFPSGSKGRLVTSADELVREYEAFMARNQYSEMVRTRDPEVVWPVIQEYRPEAMENIYSIAGFADSRAGIFVARGSRKIFQHPRRIGVGLCFDAAPVRPDLAKCIETLCANVGHYGAFEVEFIHTAKGDRYLMTDFNPRYYGQMGFEIARGLPIPLMVHAAATGDAVGLRALVADATRAANSGARLYCHQFLFKMTLATQRMSGRLTRDEVARWEAWFADQAGRRVDAVDDTADLRPATLDRAQLMLGWMRHPRAFVRTMFLDA